MKLLLSTLFLFYISVCWSQVPQEVEQFDISVYGPQKYSVSDLVFDVEIEGLKDRLNEKKSIGEIKKIFFRVYWEISSGFKVEVIGLPNGFNELKASLSNLVLLRMDYVIPSLIKDQLKGLQIKSIGEKEYSAFDPSGKSYITETRIKFDQENVLKKITITSPQGTRSSEYEYTKKPWSKNKLSLDSVKIEINEGLQSTVILNSIEYLVADGVGFPKKISVDSELKLNDKIQSENAQSSKEQLVYNFSNYAINSGKAKQFHRKGQ